MATAKDILNKYGLNSTPIRSTDVLGKYGLLSDEEKKAANWAVTQAQPEVGPPADLAGRSLLDQVGAGLSAFGDYAVSGFADSVAGAARAIGEDPSLLTQAANPLMAIGRQTGLVARPPADPNLLRFADEFSNPGRAQEAAATLNQAGIPEDSIAASLARGGGSVGNMAASLGAGLITRSPAVGALAAGAGSFGSAYEEGAGPDATVEERQRRATLQAGIEAAAERVGLGYILPTGLGGTVGRLAGATAPTRVLAAGAVGGAEEAATTALQMASDEALGYQDYSAQDYARGLQDAAVAGTAFSAVARAGTLPADRRTTPVLPDTGDPAFDAGKDAAATLDTVADVQEAVQQPVTPKPRVRVVDGQLVPADAPATTVAPPATVRVYHGGDGATDGNGGRWVTTQKSVAEGYAKKSNAPLWYVDLPANDPRVNDATYADQGVKQGFQFNFELTPEEALNLKRVDSTPSVDDSLVPADEADISAINQQLTTEQQRTQNAEARNRVVRELTSARDRTTATNIERLLGDGRITFYGDQATLPEGANSATDKGYFDGQRIYLNESKLGEGEATAVALHEIKHYMDQQAETGGQQINRRSLRQFIGNESNQRVNNRITELARTGNTIAKEALEDARFGATTDGQFNQAVFDDEVVPYFLQRMAAARSTGRPIVRRATEVVKDIISAAKARIADFGIDLNLTENDILYLGKQLVGEAARSGTAATQSGQGRAQKGRATLVGPRAQNFQRYAEEGIVFRGALDNLPRAEIDDSKTSIRPEGKKLIQDRGSTFMGAFFNHPELYDNYPEMKRTRVRLFTPEEQKANPNIDGQAEAEDNTIAIHPRVLENENDLRRLLVHEGQHMIQEREGFIPGANPSEFMDPKDQQAFSRAKTNIESFLNTVDRGILNDLESRLPDSLRGAVPSKILNGASKLDPSLNSYSREERAALREYRALLGEYTPLLEKSMDAIDKYRRTGGEVEARTVENRIGLTAGERRETPFSESSERMAGGVRAADLVDNTNPASGSRFAGVRAAIRQKALSQGASAPPAGRASRERPQNPQTETAAFKRWFGDSKVVDANGNPLVVYHGTKGDFDSFDINKAGAVTAAASARKGFFFTDSADVATGYSALGPDETVTYTGPSYTKAELNELARLIESSDRTFVNPKTRTEERKASYMPDQIRGVVLQMEETGDSFQEAIAKQAGLGTVYALGGDLTSTPNPSNSNIIPTYLSLKNPLIRDFKGSSYRDETYNDLLKQARANGNDGAIFENTFDEAFGTETDNTEPHNVYVVFEPTQIKSAIGNSGEFSPTNPSMRASRSRPEQPERVRKRLAGEGVTQPTSRRAPVPTQARGVVPERASERFVEEKTTPNAERSIVSKLKVAGDAALSAVAPSTRGKATDVNEIMERSLGEAVESKVRAAQSLNLLEKSVNRVPKTERNAVKRQLALASNSDPAIRNSAIESLKKTHPAVYANYDSMRNQIRQWGLDAVVSIRDSGKQLTKKDVAVITKILKNLDSYVTRTYRVDFKGPIAEQLKKDTLGAWSKGDRASEGAKAFEEARLYLRDTLQIGAMSGTKAKKPADYDFESLEQLEARHAEWVSRENAPTLFADATDQQRETYINTLLSDLQRVRKEMPEAEYLQKLDDKALRLTKELIDTVNTNSSKLVQFFRGARQDNTIVSTRSDVPEPIRKLWGEVTEPTAALAITMMRQGEFLARQKMLRELYDIGLGRYFVDQKDARSDVFTERLQGETFGPLDGMYATPSFKQAVESNIEPLNSWRKVFEAMSQGKADIATQAAAGQAVAFLSSAGSFNKKMTVVANPASWVNNFLGGPATPIMQGFVPGDGLARGVKAARDLIGPSFNERLSPEAQRVLKANLQESGQVGEIQQAQKDIIQNLLLDDGSLGALNRAGRKADAKAVDAYAMTDVVWKLSSFFAKVDWLKDYYKAKGVTRTAEQIDREAAEYVKSRAITFSRAAPLVKFTERLGVTSYAPYFYETYRTLAASFIGAWKYVQDGRAEGGPAGAMKVRLGMKAGVGTTAALFYNRAILPAYEVAGAVALAGLAGLGAMEPPDEEEQAKLDIIRKGMSDFYVGKELTLWRKTEDGKYIFIEPGRVNPNDPATSPFAAFVSGDPETAGKALAGLFFGNQGIAAILGVGSELATGDKAKKPSAAYKMPESYAEMVDALQNSALSINPDTTAQFTRVMEKYVPTVLRTTLREATEDTGLTGSDKFLAAMGQPFAIFDPKKDIRMSGFRDYNDPVDKAKEDFKTVITTRNPSDEVIKDAYLRSLKMEHKAYTRMREVVEAAKAAGASNQEISGILKDENGLNKAQISSLISGRFQPTFISPASVSNSRKEEVKADSTKASQVQAKYTRIDRIIRQTNNEFKELLEESN